MKTHKERLLQFLNEPFERAQTAMKGIVDRAEGLESENLRLRRIEAAARIARKSQKQYFAQRNAENLILAKKAEADLDNAIGV